MKHKALEPKSEKCSFVGYSEYVKGYRFLQPKYKNIIVRRDVKFDENISTYEPSSVRVPHFNSITSSSEDDIEDENASPPLEDIPSALQLPRWVCSC